MPAVFEPHLDMLPAAQLRLWPELGQTPGYFTLYGGTALALRLGHRASIDFDFFSFADFDSAFLLETVPYLKDAEIQRSAANNLTVMLDRGAPVQLQFFGNLNLGQVALSEFAQGPQIQVASLLDLAGTKAAVVTRRAEEKDYLDIYALLTRAGITLPTMLAAAAIIYGDQFNPLLSLKAISYHDDPGLAALPKDVRNYLSEAVYATDPAKLPQLSAIRRRK